MNTLTPPMQVLLDRARQAIRDGIANLSDAGLVEVYQGLMSLVDTVPPRPFQRTKIIEQIGKMNGLGVDQTCEYVSEMIPHILPLVKQDIMVNPSLLCVESEGRTPGTVDCFIVITSFNGAESNAFTINLVHDADRLVATVSIFDNVELLTTRQVAIDLVTGNTRNMAETGCRIVSTEVAAILSLDLMMRQSSVPRH